MDKRTKHLKKKRPLPPEAANYEIGYKKPPKENRFKPGQCGNRNGRPKGTVKKTDLPGFGEERMKSIILTEAYRTISVRDGEKNVDISVIRATIRGLALSAASRQPWAQRLFTELLLLVETENRTSYAEFAKTAIEYKIDWEHELERRKGLGITAPDPIPHPDHIIIKPNGEVQIIGPMTKQQKVKWDKCREQKAGIDEDIAMFTQMLKDDPDNELIKQEIEHANRMRALITKVVPD